jgi:hypothetical protein
MKRDIDLLSLIAIVEQRKNTVFCGSKYLSEVPDVKCVYIGYILDIVHLVITKGCSISPVFRDFLFTVFPKSLNLL